MRLGLSSAAAPDASLEELLEICVRRGLSALELRESDGHGVTGHPHGMDGAVAQERARSVGVEITGLRSSTGGDDLALARVAAAAGAPVLVAGGCCVSSRTDRGVGLSSVGAGIAVTIEGDPSPDDMELAGSCGCQVAWDVEVASGNVGAAAEPILATLGSRLRHVRILGGGPEVAMHEGQGVGELMGRLALAGYTGSLILAPSSTRYRVAWQNWLGRRGGWGCGSKQEDPSLVNLNAAALAGGGR